MCWLVDFIVTSSMVSEPNNFLFLLRPNIIINFEHCNFFSRATYFTLIFKEKIHSSGSNHSLVSSQHLTIYLLKMALERSSVTYF